MNKKHLLFKVFFKAFLFLSFFCIYGCNIKSGKIHSVSEDETIEVSSVLLSKNILSLEKNKEESIYAVIMPKNSTDKKIEWSSADSGIASINQNGIIKGVGEGKTVITAKAGNKTASCEVTVVKNGFVFVYTPDKYIEGKDSDNTYTDPNFPPEYFKGVFIKGRKVKITPYAMAKYEVTYKLWNEIYEWAIKNGYKFANKGRMGSSGCQSEDEPVTDINWHDCIIWCNAYTEMLYNSDKECVYRRSAADNSVLKDASMQIKNKENFDIFICDYAYADMNKKGFRLPTEAEWEFAARFQEENTANTEKYGITYLINLDNGSGAEGNSEEALKKVAWYRNSSTGSTHDAGLKQKNGLGLYDMSGNVAEWCFDWYSDDITISDESYTIEGTVTDPQGRILLETQLHIESRVKRGGHYDDHFSLCLTGTRSGFAPFYVVRGHGFRLVYRP